MSRSLFLVLLLPLIASAEDWPQWRGSRLDGTSTGSGFPTRWSATENVRWRTELPGTGHASPIVFGDRVFTVSATAGGERLLLSLDRASGRILWQQIVVQSPLERKHRENSHASSTPSTDGERVFCTFLDQGQVVVAAYDFAGKQLWTKRVGGFSSVHGFCSTPILHKDTIIVNCDQDGDGYIVALARKDGAERWRIERPNKTRSYCAPLIRDAGGRTQMVLSGSKCVASYDPDSGKLIWTIDGPTDQWVASPVFNAKANLFFVSGGFPDHHLLAIKPDSTGNITDTPQIVWHGRQGVAYVPSPIAEGDWFFITDDRGFAHCFDAKTGEQRWEQRFGRQHASLVSAGGLVYFLNDDGECRVVKAGAKFELVATNVLGEPTYASPALSDGQIFLRGDKHLYCIDAKR
ncbi:MAG: PQQ-binding-like beta-propeller repeat protein [Chthoniobacteraceae bacterium]